MSFLARIRERKMQPHLEKEKKFYNSIPKDGILESQLKKFNEIWTDISKHVNFYKDIVRRGPLPSTFENYEKFLDLPIISREIANSKKDQFINEKKAPDSWGTTGGSTGNPLQFPKWDTETSYCEPSVWYVRDFY